MSKRILTIATLFTFTLLMTSCHDQSSKDGIPAEGDGAKTETNTDGGSADADAHAGHDHDGHDHDHAAGDDMDGMASMGADLGFEEGTWEWNLLNYMNGGEGSGTFNLDQITQDKGEELSATGKAQLDNLAKLLEANPDMKIDLTAHSRKAKNDVGRTAKKGATKARAIWVKQKIKARGVEGDRINTVGAADEFLMEGVAGDDDSQRRLTVTLVK